MINRVKDFYRLNQDNEIFIYFWLFLLCVLCYGILIPFLGFYWDSFPYLFQFHSFGSAGFPEFVASDRPFSAWIFMLTTELFKFNPLGYHLVAFFLRFVCVLLFFQILKEIWPQKRNFIFFASSIFAVYPGFLQQPIAYLYCHHFSAFAIFLFSILLMAKAAKAEKINPFILGLSILGTVHVFIIENFALLELIRPFILWLVIKKQSRNGKASLRRIFLLWFPFAMVLAIFMVWRVFIFKFPTYQPLFLEGLKLDPFKSIYGLFRRIPEDFYTTTIGAWIKSFTFPQISSFGRTSTFLFWILAIFSLVITFIFTILRTDDKNVQQEFKEANFSIILGSILLFFFAGSIIWVLGLPLKIAFSWDRLTLAFIPAVSILFGALLDLPKHFKILPKIIFVLLISAAVGSHFENGMRFKRDWEDFIDMQKQLSWRIPSLEKNTILITDELPLIYFSDNSLTAALNWRYSKEIGNYQLPYMMNFTKARLGKSLPSLKPGTIITQQYRTNSFIGSTDRLILFYHQPPGCIHFADPDLDVLNPLISKDIRPFVSLSRLDLIGNEEKKNSVFFIEDHSDTPSWCYYFQKASLAVQNQYWEEAARLGDIAFNSDDYPNDASERLPFIEAYAMHGEFEKAVNLSNQVIEISPLYKPMVCKLWERINNSSSNVGDSAFLKSQEYLSINCTNNFK